MSEANPWYWSCNERVPEGAKEKTFFRPFQGSALMTATRGSQKALTPGYDLAPLRGFEVTGETSKKIFLVIVPALSSAGTIISVFCSVRVSHAGLGAGLQAASRK
jgi:hypothetical protein